jgi:hypothetical protein
MVDNLFIITSHTSQQAQTSCGWESGSKSLQHHHLVQKSLSNFRSIIILIF